MVHIGIDTSCYTTSVAVMNSEGKIINDCRKLLDVDKNKRGLRQSEMVFQHIRNLRELYPEILEEIASVTVSCTPRPAENSYMPAFLVGESFGSAIAKTVDANFYPLTHQHGHAGAAIIGKNEVFNGSYLALHVSGGTTELLKVDFDNNIVTGIETVGGTKDISAGQLIDRIGVKLGIQFPCGPEVSDLARNGNAERIIYRTPDCFVNFSGAENRLYKMVEDGRTREDISSTLLSHVTDVLSALIKNAVSKYNISNVILFGGVIRSEYIRPILDSRFDNLVFSDIRYSSDNACGLAYQGMLKYNKKIMED